MKTNIRSISASRAALAGIMLALSPTLLATSPMPPQPDDELLPLLYETLGGDNWHRSDGWLDPEVDWCDWYGVECAETGVAGYTEFRQLELPGNNLVGTLTPELVELLLVHQAPERELDLSDNAIAGELTHFPRRTEDVNLAGNLLTGTLPEFTEEPPGNVLERLRLTRNDFEGAIPESWKRLQLRRLELSDNRLNAGAGNAFVAMHGVDQSFLYLNGNHFAAEISEDDIMAARGLAKRGSTNVGAGLDLCYNDFIVDDPTVRDWIAARHVGSPDFELCLGRERTAIDATASGSWYHPEHSGEGVSVILLDNGAPLLYSFGFDTEGGQQWLFELGTTSDKWLRWDPVRETRGYFGEGIAVEEDITFVRGTGRFRADRVGADRLSIHRHYYDALACGPWSPQTPVEDPGPGLCPPPLFDDRLDYQRLSRLAGTTCDNGSDYEQYSGAWYNPQQSGEGFLIEVMPDNRVVVYWFTYTPDGSGEQAWMVGNGDLSPNTPTLPGLPPANQFTVTLYQPQGASYGPDFDAEDVDLVEWGELRISFAELDRGEVRFDSNFEAYGSGEFEIESLARPMLAECEQ